MRLGPDGASQLATWEHAAARGSETARAKLMGPEFPEALQYLWLWTLELFGRSGTTEYGLAALSYQTIESWAHLTGRHPTASEVQGLIRLDLALRSTGKAEVDDDEREVEMTAKARAYWGKDKG